MRSFEVKYSDVSRECMHAAQNSARNPTFAGQYSFWSLSCRINGPAQDCSNRIDSLGIWVDRNVVPCA